MSSFLFVHFTGEGTEDGEQIYFSVSKDGMKWKDLNGGNLILRSEIGTKGVRDPFILRSQIDNRFYIIATDLRIKSGGGWDAARSRASRKMIIWSSEDLVNWGEPWAYEFPREDFGCVWAPESVYDEKRGAYLVFWSSFTKETYETEPKFKIYASYTRDFREFTQPEVYIERNQHVIDTTIAEDNGIFYRFSKDEVTKGIVVDCGSDLQGSFTEITGTEFGGIKGVEGPATFYIPEKKTWCLLLDRFATHRGYMPLLCSDLSTCDFKEVPEAEYDMGKTMKRHGSVLAVTEEEYDRLCARYC